MFARTAIAGVRLSRVGIRNLATKTKPNNNGFKGLKVKKKVKFLVRYENIGWWKKMWLRIL